MSFLMSKEEIDSLLDREFNKLNKSFISENRSIDTLSNLEHENLILKKENEKLHKEIEELKKEIKLQKITINFKN